ncbi:hypothetical protein D9M68_389420 [compost metagenome]
MGRQHRARLHRQPCPADQADAAAVGCVGLDARRAINRDHAAVGDDFEVGHARGARDREVALADAELARAAEARIVERSRQRTEIVQPIDGQRKVATVAAGTGLRLHSATEVDPSAGRCIHRQAAGVATVRMGGQVQQAARGQVDQAAPRRQADLARIHVPGRVEEDFFQAARVQAALLCQRQVARAGIDRNAAAQRQHRQRHGHALARQAQARAQAGAAQ